MALQRLNLEGFVGIQVNRICKTILGCLKIISGYLILFLHPSHLHPMQGLNILQIAVCRLIHIRSLHSCPRRRLITAQALVLPHRPITQAPNLLLRTERVITLTIPFLRPLAQAGGIFSAAFSTPWVSPMLVVIAFI